ncbi:MAG: hypothetical protein R3185_07430, partial [Candidatus Thermoplasmatota archaeon]|nr:hypothetical protein [Candidatus Thermoplasmatota archaeon]
MPSQQDIAPHIEELTRALGTSVSEEEIRRELERYLEHGVPLHQAKKDIRTTLGGGRPLRKKIKHVSPSDPAVDTLARVLSVQAREITARGEQKTIWEGELADETGRIAYTSWVDHQLEPGQVLAISNAYIRTWQGNPQLNIGDNTQVEAGEADSLPPLAELQQTEQVSTPAQAGGGSEQKIADLKPGMNSIIVQGRLLSRNAREVTVKGEPKTLWEGELADETGRVSYTAWHDHGVDTGDVVRIENAYVRSFSGVASLNFCENSVVEKLEDRQAPPAEKLKEKEALVAPTAEEVDVKDLRPGMNAVVVEGRLLKVNERQVNVKGEPKTLWEGEVADETGRVSYTSWDDHGLAPGKVVRIENAYVRSFRG